MHPVIVTVLHRQQQLWSDVALEILKRYQESGTVPEDALRLPSVMVWAVIIESQLRMYGIAFCCHVA
jgi:hypothetical protein